MSIVWAVIVSVILALIIYGIIGSHIRDGKRKAEREHTLRKAEGGIREGGKYDFHLSNGSRLMGMVLIGSLPLEPAEAYGWGDMLILAEADGKKKFVRRGAIRMVAEA